MHHELPIAITDFIGRDSTEASVGQNIARVAFKRGAYLRHFVYSFAELLSDRLTRALIARAKSF